MVSGNAKITKNLASQMFSLFKFYFMSKRALLLNVQFSTGNRFFVLSLPEKIASCIFSFLQKITIVICSVGFGPPRSGSLVIDMDLDPSLLS